MIKITIDHSKIKAEEKYILEALAESLKKDLEGVECSTCKEKSWLNIKLNRKRINALLPQIEACCNEFRKEVENVLLTREEELL